MITVSIYNGTNGPAGKVSQDSGIDRNFSLATTYVSKERSDIVLTTIDGKELARAHFSQWTPNTIDAITDLGILSAPPVLVDASGLAQESTLQSIESSLSGTLNVNVTNPTDLTTLETTLAGVLTAVQNIDANTDGIEGLLNTVITEIQANGTLNNTNLQAVIAELQSIDANTDNLEAQLANIITNTTGSATAANQVSLQSISSDIKFLLDVFDPRNKKFGFDIEDAQTGGTVEYGVVGIRMRAGNTDRVSFYSVTGNAQTSDDYAVYLYEYDRDQIIPNISGNPTWVDSGTKVQSFVSPLNGVYTVTNSGIKKTTFQMRDINNINNQFIELLEEDKEYLLVIRPLQTGSDTSAGITIQEFHTP